MAIKKKVPVVRVAATTKKAIKKVPVAKKAIKKVAAPVAKKPVKKVAAPVAKKPVKKAAAPVAKKPVKKAKAAPELWFVRLLVKGAQELEKVESVVVGNAGVAVTHTPKRATEAVTDFFTFSQVILRTDSSVVIKGHNELRYYDDVASFDQDGNNLLITFEDGANAVFTLDENTIVESSRTGQAVDASSDEQEEEDEQEEDEESDDEEEEEESDDEEEEEESDDEEEESDDEESDDEEEEEEDEESDEEWE